MVAVPSQYQQYITQASQATGLPQSVVAAQAQAESNFNPSAVSGAGAEGFWQFEPATYNAYAAQAGVPAGSEFNVADETKVYGVYMNSLLKQEGGSVFRALEAYNAGPGNLNAGSSYASNILKTAGQSQGLTANGVQNAQLTGFNPFDPFGSISGGINNAIGGAIGDLGNSLINSIFSALGIPSLKDLLQRLGLILLGVALVLVGLNMLVKIQVGPVKVGGGNAPSYSKGSTKVSSA